VLSSAEVSALRKRIPTLSVDSNGVATLQGKDDCYYAPGDVGLYLQEMANILKRGVSMKSLTLQLALGTPPNLCHIAQYDPLRCTYHPEITPVLTYHPNKTQGIHAVLHPNGTCLVYGITQTSQVLRVIHVLEDLILLSQH
jgi:hypothetical protein